MNRPENPRVGGSILPLDTISRGVTGASTPMQYAGVKGMGSVRATGLLQAAGAWSSPVSRGGIPQRSYGIVVGAKHLGDRKHGPSRAANGTERVHCGRRLAVKSAVLHRAIVWPGTRANPPVSIPTTPASP